METKNLTVTENPQVVRVGSFRGRISHLEQSNTDFHACVGPRERASWMARARDVGSALIATGCKRATARDWERREVAIGRSAELIGRVSDELRGA